MIKIAVIDDEENIRKYLISQIKKQERELFIEEYSLAEQYLMSDSDFDLIFLDIEMGSEEDTTNGMELARTIRKNTQGIQPIIIFVTGYEKYVYDAFDVEAFQYLLKPVDENKFTDVFERALMKILSDKQKKEKVLTVSYGSVNKSIAFSDISFIESVGHKVIIHQKNENFEYYANMSDLEQELQGQFFRIHKGYLINLEYVESYSKKEVELSGGERLLISKYRYQEFVKAYLCYMEEIR